MAKGCGEHNEKPFDKEKFKLIFEKHGYPSAFVDELWETRPRDALCESCLEITARELTHMIPEIEVEYGPAVRH